MAEGDVRPKAAVLIDSENMFFVFQSQDKKDRWSDGKLAQVRKAATDLGVGEVEMATLGPEIFLRLGAWLARRYRVRPARSYGVFGAPGVAAIRKPLLDRGRWTDVDIEWTQTNVWEGADVADEVLKEDLRLYSKDDDTDVIVVGSNDMKVDGGILPALLPLLQGRQKIVVIRPPGLGWYRFKVGNDLHPLKALGEVATLTRIYGAEQERVAGQRLAPSAGPLPVPAPKAKAKLTPAEKDERDINLVAAWYSEPEADARAGIQEAFEAVTVADHVLMRSARLLHHTDALAQGPRRDFVRDTIGEAAEARRVFFEEQSR